jgi:phospholipid/cholesterol/gamma-HCH transport system substrate-binding protein/paraquat-inducible protein B
MKPNYFKIGVFVIVAFILIISAIVVFGAGLFTGEEIYFETYFDGSVSGLNIGAPMENRGVRMGQVEKITFAGNVYDMEVGSEDYFKYGNYVMVLVSVDVENVTEMTSKQREENVKQLVARGLRIRLATNLLTGQAYLQGAYLDPERFPLLEVPWEPKNYYISSAPSDFTTMKQSLDSILSKLEEIDIKTINDLIAELLVSVNKAVDDANVPEISSGIQDLVVSADQAVKEINKVAISKAESLVENANQAIDDFNVPAISNELQSLLAEARQTNQHLQELLKKPEKTNSQMANVAAMIANLNKTLLRIDRLMSNQTPQIDQTLENLRAISEDLKELTNSLKQHPSQLIFSEPPSKPEVSK